MAPEEKRISELIQDRMREYPNFNLNVSIEIITLTCLNRIKNIFLLPEQRISYVPVYCLSMIVKNYFQAFIYLFFQIIIQIFSV